MAYYIRLMRGEDIEQVTEIDREAFPTLWPPANYKRELENRLANYIVVCDEEKEAEGASVEDPLGDDGGGLMSRVRRLLHHEPPKPGRDYIVGFVGFWIMAGEAHIISIAVREAYRRQGIGELLLISMIDLATELNAHMVTLEVRVSNATAQGLYRKYGFAHVGQRRRYYVDDGEDALIMSTEDITSAPFQIGLQQLKQAHSKRWGIVLYQIAR